MKKKILPLAMMAGLSGSASLHQPPRLFGSILAERMLAREGLIDSDDCLYVPQESQRLVKVRLLDAQGAIACGPTLFNELPGIE